MAKKIRNEIISLCDKLDMPFYQRALLAAMVYRKVKHPEETIEQLIDKAVEDTVPKRYKKLGKSCMRVSVSKEKEQLEEKLHDCKNLPEDLFEGDIVENTVKYYYGAVFGME